MRTITSGDDTVKVFDQKVYIQETNTIKFHHEGEDAEWVKMWTNLHGTSTTPLAKYTLNASGDVTIDMTEYLRAYRNVTAIYVECQQDTAITISVAVSGLSNPENALAPDNYSHAVIDLPSMMIAAFAGKSLIAEYMAGADDCSIKVGGGSVTTPKGVDMGVTIASTATDYDISIDGESAKVRSIRPQMCGTKYAMAKWQSYTGLTRCHTFEVHGVTITTDGAVSLSALDAYNTIKGKVESFKLVLTDLDRYDMHYYSDIITSSKVEVSLDGATWRQVEITTSSVTIPDGDAGEFNTLEIAVNFKKHDAVAL